MMTFMRLIMLFLLFVYSCAMIAAILHAIDHWGYMHAPDIDWERYISFFKWPVIVMGTSILIFTTSIGDFIIGLCLPTRRQALKEEQKIAPALDLLHKLYKDKYGVSIKPKAHVMDLPYIDGISFGRKTIAVSSGLLKMASEEELTAILAHEFGHLRNKDGFFNVALSIASYPLFVITLISGVFFFYTWLIALLIMFMLSPILTGLCLGGWLMISLYSLLEKLTKWPAEYKADRFSMELGFGPALISLFERIEDEDVRGKEGFLTKFAYSHPPTALRIDRIERAMLKQNIS